MPIIWNPTGHLDVATDPSDLPSVSGGPSSEASDAFQRLKNMRNDRAGMAITRDGSSKVSTADTETPIHLIVEQNRDRYVFAGTRIYKNEESIASGLISQRWSAIKYNSSNSLDEEIFALNGINRRRISGTSVQEWGLDAPTVAPTVEGVTAAVTHDWEIDEVSDYAYQFTFDTEDFTHTYGWEAGFIEGGDAFADTTFASTWLFERYNHSDKFKVKYTYVRQDGDTVLAESNGSPDIVVGVDITNMWHMSWTAALDTQVTHVRFYRTLANGSLYLFETVAVAADGAAGSVTLTDTDGELGEGIPTDHNRPPENGTVIFGPDFDGTTFILAGNKLYPSKAKQPEYYPLDTAIEVSPIQVPLVGGTIWNGNVYVATTVDIFQIQGSSGSTFFPYRLSAQTGTQSSQVFLGIMGHGLFHLGPDGLYIYNGEIDRNITEARFEPIFRGVSANGMPGIDLGALDEDWMVHWDNKVYFGYMDQGDTGFSMLVINLNDLKARYYDYGRVFTTATIDTTSRRILAGAV